MKDFMMSAVPLVLVGLALALLAVNHSKIQQNFNNHRSRIAMGAGFGLLLGVMLNSCGLWKSHTPGILAGLLWGMVLGALYQGKEAPNDSPNDQEEEVCGN